jgi:ABC-type sugar transport system permease subunit
MIERQTAGISQMMRTTRLGMRARFARATTPYLFVGPFFIVFFTFFAYPVGYSFYVSLHSWTGQGAMKWVGWDNYNFVLNDNYFVEALQTTGLMWLSVPLTMLISLIVAVIWNRPRMRGRSVLLVIYLLPTVISIVAISLVFRILYDPIAGPIDYALGSMGLPQVDWLGDETSARVGLIILRIWETIGLGVLFFAAALQAIPQDYYDAASVDGSGPIHQFWSLTVPLLARTILFIMVINTLSAFSLFAEPYLVMNQGGPNNATVTLGFYLFQKVVNLDLGTASAISFLTTLITMVVSVLLFLAARRWTRD